MHSESRDAGNTQANPSTTGGIAGGNERRLEPRVACERPIQMLRLADESVLHAQLVDLSRHGLGVVVPISLCTGEEFVVMLRAAKATGLVYTVHRSLRLQEGSGWFVGAELIGCVGAPSAAELKFELDELIRGLGDQSAAPVNRAHAARSQAGRE